MSKVSLPLYSAYIKGGISVQTPFLSIIFDQGKKTMTLSGPEGIVASLPADHLVMADGQINYFVDEIGQVIFIMREYDGAIFTISTKPYLTIRKILISEREEETSLQYLEIFKCDEWYVVSSEYEYAVYDIGFERSFTKKENPFARLNHTFTNGELWFLPSPPDPAIKKAIEFYSWKNIETELTEQEMSQFNATRDMMRKFIPGL